MLEYEELTNLIDDDPWTATDQNEWEALAWWRRALHYPLWRLWELVRNAVR